MASRGKERTGEEESDALIGLIVAVTIIPAAILLMLIAALSYWNPSIVVTLTNSWTIASAYSFVMFLAAPLPLLFVHWLSPWSETRWDYVYAFTAACAYNYAMPAVTFTAFIVVQAALLGDITRLLDWTDLVTLASVVLTVFLISIALQAYGVKERRPQTGAASTSPIAFVLMQATVALLAYRTTQIAATIPIVYYLTTFPAIITYVLTWLALVTYLSASESNPLWLAAAVAATLAGITIPSALP